MTEQERYFDNITEEEFAEGISIRRLIDDITDRLAAMAKEERLEWFRQAQYPHPVSFTREIDGTIYTVNAHFKQGAFESLQEKTERILLKNHGKD
ncbi:transposon-encoded TnpW family protein [Enterococcus faecium]|uniref:transposon-encoded TnpW family protein n=1 Tax=Enterococcus faecium TaxID=1352 RepID=UPI00190E7E30|nr:transposon-encoded TnpW family protein [Enterococcus faecium]MBK4832026.1 hypothetical protein [Enterococcus faecium]